MDQDFVTEPIRETGRGSTVLTLGILALVFAGCFPAGLALGYLAISKAREDLPRFESGEYVGEGYGLTKAGKICGIVGMCLAGLQCVLLFGQLVFN